MGALALALGALGYLAPAASADDTITVDGGASGVSAGVNLGIITVNVPPTPSVSLPPGGGNSTNSLANVNVPGVVSTGVLNVGTQGATGPGGFASSTASVADPNVLGGTATALLVQSECLSDQSGSTGSSTLVGANILGTPLLNIQPPANTTLGIPGVVTVTLNGQSGSTTADATDLTVRALEVNVLQGLSVGDVVVSESACSAHFGGGGGPGGGGPEGGGPGEGAGAGGPGGAGVRQVSVVTGARAGAAQAVTGAAPLTG
jgi:nuclear receptor co-repressor 1